MSLFKKLFGGSQTTTGASGGVAVQTTSASSPHTYNAACGCRTCMYNNNYTFNGSASTWSTPLGGQIVTSGGSGGTAYSGSIYTGIGGPPLTTEESKELGDLMQERAAASKLLKIAVFKKVPTVLRQQVVNQIYWYRAIKEMAATEAEKSDREKALELRQAINYGGSTTAYWSNGVTFTMQGSYINTPPLFLPEGLTEDDIINAHNEATLEESITDEDSN